MFQDLDDNLREMLNEPKAPAELVNAEVSFETLEKTNALAHARVNLFLYEV